MTIEITKEQLWLIIDALKDADFKYHMAEKSAKSSLSRNAAHKQRRLTNKTIKLLETYEW